MNKNPFLFAGVAAFVALFYDQGIGGNLSLFAFLLWGILFFTSNRAYHTKTFWLLSCALLLSLCSFAWYGDPLSFAAVFCTLLLIVTKLYAPRLSILLVPFACLFNFASIIVRAPFINKWIAFHSIKTGEALKKTFYYFLIPVALAIVFLALYASSSDLFSSFFQINWSPNVYMLIFLTSLGFFLLFGFVHFWAPAVLLVQNRYFKDTYPLPPLGIKFNFLDPHYYRRSGEISLIVLNAIVLLFLATFVKEQFAGHTNGGGLSRELHERVYILIFSILMAISVIMLFFNSAESTQSRYALLRKIAYVWIGLNTLLVIIVAMKNGHYIQNYGLTFKRVGVYIFLILCVTGLLITILKIRNHQTNSYLASRMVWSVYITLVLNSFINWSWIVTRYNIAHSEVFDKEYALRLPYNKQLLFESGTLSSSAISRMQLQQKQRPFLSRTIYPFTLSVNVPSK